MSLTPKPHSENFNLEDVAHLLRRLNGYKDDYSQILVGIFEEYLQHKDFEKLHEELFKAEGLLNKPLPNAWDIDAHMSYLEVIYPA